MYTRFLRQLIRLTADRRGGVSVMLALMLVPLVAVMGLATETASWYFFQRAAQNAADAAALAAAINGCDTASTCKTATYKDEAKAVVSKYSFNSDTYTTVLPDTVACPGDSTVTCYRVTITKNVPVFLTRIVGYGGTTAVGGVPVQTISATAIAHPRVKAGYCLITTNNVAVSKNETLTLNGTTDLKGCDVYVNGDAKCSGDAGIGTAYYTGNDQKCGVTETPITSTPADVTAKLADFASRYDSASIATKTCSPGFSGNSNLTSVVPLNLVVCGNLTVPSGTTITLPANQVIVIRNGNLQLNGTLISPTMTIVFDTTGSTNPGFIKGSGTLQYNAPSSDLWTGIALYQHQVSTNKAANAASYAGNSPTLSLTGLVYAPYANLTFSGTVSKYGKSCLSFIVNSITSNGGNFFKNITNECEAAGLNLPTSNTSLARQALVQ